VTNAIQHATFIICVFDLLHFDHLRLLQHLHRIEAMVVIRLHQVNTTEAPRSQGALELKVLLGIFALCDALLLLSWLLMLLLVPLLIYDVVDAGGIACMLR
jgi:hypothetical protein